MLAIMKRELKAYFASPIGYVFVGLLILLAGILSASTNLLGRDSDYASVLGSISYVLLFAVPVLTMRLLAEETRNRTDQLLLTSPLGVVGIVLGKYLAAELLFLIAILLTFVYPMIMSYYTPGGLALAEVAGAYLGLILLGSSLIAIGLFVSSLTDNQLVSAIGTFAVLLIIWLLDLVLKNLPSSAGFVAVVLEWFSLPKRYGDFCLGILTPGSILYYLTFCGLFLYLTIYRIEGKRRR
jgi:ABC-2 type transport system permease protein